MCNKNTLHSIGKRTQRIQADPDEVGLKVRDIKGVSSLHLTCAHSPDMQTVEKKNLVSNQARVDSFPACTVLLACGALPGPRSAVRTQGKSIFDLRGCLGNIFICGLHSRQLCPPSMLGGWLQTWVMVAV